MCWFHCRLKLWIHPQVYWKLPRQWIGVLPSYCYLHWFSNRFAQSEGHSIFSSLAVLIEGIWTGYSHHFFHAIEAAKPKVFWQSRPQGPLLQGSVTQSFQVLYLFGLLGPFPVLEGTQYKGKTFLSLITYQIHSWPVD